MTLTFIDLFSGAGLFSSGMIQAGFAPRLAIEIDSLAVESYRRNVASCAVRGSVADAELAAGAPAVDLVIAGPPCQGFSTLGRRDPTDQRNALGLAVLPWLDASRAPVAVIENVPPFLRSPQWRMLRDALLERGYHVDTWELDASWFGAPQFRRRAFTIASRLGEIAAPAPSSAVPRTAAEELARPIQPGDSMHVWPIPKGIAAERIPHIPPEGDRRDLVRNHPSLCPPSWFSVGNQATDAWGRIVPGDPSNTLRCAFQNPSKGRYLHPTEHRTLSLREGARLQGIPDHWTFAGRPYPIARQIGNGVPIALAAAVGRTIYGALSAAAGRGNDEVGRFLTLATGSGTSGVPGSSGIDPCSIMVPGGTNSGAGLAAAS